MGDVNLEIKLKNLEKKVDNLEVGAVEVDGVTITRNVADELQVDETVMNLIGLAVEGVQDNAGDINQINAKLAFPKIKQIYFDTSIYKGLVEVTTDLSKYDGCLVTYQDADQTPIKHTVYVPKNVSWKIGGFSGQYGDNISRTCIVSDNKVTISDSNATNYASAFIVPIEILAIKH